MVLREPKPIDPDVAALMNDVPIMPAQRAFDPEVAALMDANPEPLKRTIDPDIAELMGASAKVARRTLDPDIAELLDEGLRSKDDEPSNEAESGHPLFDKDYKAFSKSIEVWQEDMRRNFLVPTLNEIPEGYGYVGGANILSPFSPILVKDIELKRRGYPLVYCAEIPPDHTNSHLTYKNATPQIDKYSAINPKTNIRLLADINNELSNLLGHPLFKLAETISSGVIHPVELNPEAEDFSVIRRADHESTLEGIKWAKGAGILERAFMTALLRRREQEAPYDGQKNLLKIEYNYDLAFELYEQLASMEDEDGHRMYTPLTGEEFQGIVTRAMNEVYGKSPVFNQKGLLTLPFDPVKPPGKTVH